MLESESSPRPVGRLRLRRPTLQPAGRPRTPHVVYVPYLSIDAAPFEPPTYLQIRGETLAKTGRPRGPVPPRQPHPAARGRLGGSCIAALPGSGGWNRNEKYRMSQERLEPSAASSPAGSELRRVASSRQTLTHTDRRALVPRSRAAAQPRSRALLHTYMQGSPLLPHTLCS